MSSTHLQVMVATIDSQIAELATAVASLEVPAAMVAQLRLSWATLVKRLPLGEPMFHCCPICLRVLPRVATFCGNCFSRLMPEASNDA